MRKRRERRGAFNRGRARGFVFPRSNQGMSVSTIKLGAKLVLIWSMCASLLLLPDTAPAHETGPRPKLTLPAQVALEVPLAPTPVKMNGSQCLVYELHLTNFSTNRVELIRVEVLGDGTTAPSTSEIGNWKPPSTVKPDKRRMEIPIENAMVRFP
jgi:hypothetical protein